MSDEKHKPGPEPGLRTDLDWEEAVELALRKKRPRKGGRSQKTTEG